MVSIKQLKYALAVAEHKHFKSAAEACHISQPALSGAINELEKLLGFKVFERDNKRVLVTPLGSKMLRRAHDIFLAVNDLQSIGVEAANPLQEPLSLGMIPTIAPYLLPIILPSISQQFPKLDLTIDENQSHLLVKDVLNGKIDAAVLALPYECEGLLSFPFWDEDFYLVTHVDDQNIDSLNISVEDIDPERLLLLRDGHCLQDHALSVCGLVKEQSLDARGSSLATILELVSAKLGATLIPGIALPSIAKYHPELKYAHLDEPSPHRQLAFVIRPNFPRLHEIELLMNLIRSALSRHNS